MSFAETEVGRIPREGMVGFFCQQVFDQIQRIYEAKDIDYFQLLLRSKPGESVSLPLTPPSRTVRMCLSSVSFSIC